MRLPPEQYEECLEENNESYDSYNRARDEVVY